MEDVLVNQAFESAKRKGFAADSWCVEASAAMVNYIRARGGSADARRYVLPNGDGHVTVVTPAGEFDPTIGCWTEPPKHSSCGQLYRVGGLSPHRGWVIDRQFRTRHILDMDV